ncbi:valine--tRNA ligase [Patescibacteria group bacterium]|nr:valine--tRNA ligase [Patescibacteria group bacterium]MBU4481169.1 valine--tRNA ligase [Patescibacteria group bacterium]
METTYKPRNIESKIYKMWEKGGYFTPPINYSKKPFVIIMPPPNANGILHIGHAVFVTIEDIMIRYHRMKGEPTLWLPGADHAGIMTQVVYEKELAKQGKTRFDLGRKEFYKQTYEFTMKNREIMENQLRRLGASCDWSGKKFTLESKISKAVYYTFKKMYNDGLIYRGERIINWCPRCKTALSDLEVKYENRSTKLTFINYPIEDSKDFITVATTRPETMLGDTAVAVNPEDKRYKNLLKKNIKIQLPLTNRLIPLVADERVEIEFGTGAVKVTPGHDPVDFEIGEQHQLPIIKIIDQGGKVTKEAGSDYAGLDVISCRKKVIEDLEKKGLLVKQEDYQHSVGSCERCQTIIEPLVSQQWFIRIKNLAEPAIKAVKQKKIKFIPDYFTKIYYNWMENIKDWCISRQIWWGHRIPAWYCECGEMIVDINSPKTCSKCKSSNLHQDSDTLDTWFSSGQWPFTVFSWPKKTEDYKYFYPTTVMETGWDILFFWVARMIMLGIYCTGKVPFKYVYLHGLVRDKDRQKMSKSKGNVIDPLGVVDLYGADALRMALVFGTSAGSDIIISEEKIIAHRRFANKIWNAARFILTNLSGDIDLLKIKREDLQFTKEDYWILSELNLTIEKIERAFQKFNFHQAAEEIYGFFWHKFCDKTIEDIKKRLRNGQNLQDKLTGKWILYHVLLVSLKLLHPFMPFLTEEIYQLLPAKPKKALIIEDWPK